MNRSKTWILWGALLLPVDAFASEGTHGVAASTLEAAPVGRLAGSTVKSSKSNSNERMGAPDGAAARSTVKSGKSNSSDRMTAPPPRAFGAAAGVDRPGPAPRSPAAANLDGSRSN